MRNLSNLRNTQNAVRFDSLGSLTKDFSSSSLLFIVDALNLPCVLPNRCDFSKGAVSLLFAP